VPREILTREQIVKAAVDLLDAEGLEGLNMRALGTRLGSAATAVYWHVGSKDNLIALAGDLAWKEVVLPDATTVDWRTAATQMATDLYAMLTRHPWLVQAFGSVPMLSPGKARHDDHTLALYEAAGFTGTQPDQAVTAVFTFVLGNALGSASSGTLTRKLRRDGNAEALMREHQAKAIEIAAKFPRLRTRLNAPTAEYGAAPEGSFEFGLHALFDGLEARLMSRQPPTGQTQERPTTSPAGRNSVTT